MALTIKEAFQQALSAHKAGKSREAERLYRAILRTVPSHTQANYYLGLLAASANNNDFALTLFKTALEGSPENEHFWVSYINVLIKLEHFELAKEAIKQAKKNGVNSDKTRTLRKSLKGRPRGRAIVAKTPPQTDLDNLYGYYCSGNYDRAETLASLLTKKFPKHQFGWKILGAVFKEKDELYDALAPCKRSAQLCPGDFEAQINLGTVLQKLGKLADSKKSLEKAIELKPDFAEAHFVLGVTLAHMGKKDLAEAAYLKAISLKPDHSEAHLHLANLKRFTVKDTQISTMLKLCTEQNISDDGLSQIHFGLAKAYEDLGEFKQAFFHYQQGNELRKELLKVDINQILQVFEKVKNNFSKIAQYALGPEEVKSVVQPVFIVGMPRSGTSLIEQIIASHNQIKGGGELTFVTKFGAHLADGSNVCDKAKVAQFRDKYLERLGRISNHERIVTDKMPQNFLYLGLITTAFPEAKIIHVKRFPKAVAWANYKQYFGSKDIRYCYDLNDIQKYFTAYSTLMNHWKSSFGHRIYDVDYDTLTADQENKTRELIEHLGLDWDDKCLSPEQNKRSVATASHMQVREKVYQGSSKQWEKYKPFIADALEDL